MKLHVSNGDSSVLILENTQALNIGVNTAMYFKTGSGSLKNRRFWNVEIENISVKKVILDLLEQIEDELETIE